MNASKEKDDGAHYQSQEQQALFRKFFEQHYAPLEAEDDQEQHNEESESISDEKSSTSEWEGLDEVEEESGVIVIDHTQIPQTHDQTSTGDSYKTYMSALPPKSTSQPVKSVKTKARKEAGDDDSAEAANLENDLALQRLLKESHLLDSKHDSVPVGSQRHRAIDMRLRGLGSKDSILEQAKMPLSHRKGIRAKAEAVEKRRRTEAIENGIILEKPSPGPKSKSVRRDRGVGKPGIGKFSGGTLKLSRRDVQAIQGPKETSKRKRGR